MAVSGLASRSVSAGFGVKVFAAVELPAKAAGGFTWMRVGL